MYLKRLDVQGFKSFANKTVLEFAPGVTCVVGPNGTGKTNVADSLRWVLGEHASRSIRARKTEDVIFAGSDKRAPMGVAEVSISLDNSKQWLPVDFDEVVVTRRAYRNGENEYMINHARVRLRDVVELFMRAQVGQNSYAFMGQGMVEQALSLRPEDRRALIEEAADVRLYRNKLDDARNKLKATRENMERVRLLVREIEPRITQLERQAGRAVRYQELTRELAATLHVWYQHQWREVNEQLLAAMTTQDQCAEQYARAKADTKACEDGLSQLRAAIDERRGEITAREARLRNMQDYVHDLERRTVLDGERATMVAERTQELAAELASLREELAAQRRAAPPQDTSDLERRLAAAQDALTEHRTRASAIEQELHDLQRVALVSEQAAARERALADDLARRMTDAADGVARLRRERESAAEARRKLLGEIASWARDFARVLEDAAAKSRDLERALERRTRLAQSLSRGRQDTAALEEELRALRAQADAAQIRLDVIESMDVAPLAPDVGVRRILEAGGVIPRQTVPDDVELRGVVGLFGQLLRVPAGLERAVEAALAENLYAIVFEREIDMRAAVELLLDGDAGRATMYALDGFAESRPLNLIKERGVVGVASALVRCESRHRKLVDTLLGRAVVVENRALAQRFVRRGLASAVATLDGVLLRPVGSITAGSAAAVEASFAHEREVKDLPEEIARLRPPIEERERALAERAVAVGGEQREFDEIEVTIETLRTAEARSVAGTAQARARFAGLAGRMRALTEDSRHRDGEIDRMVALRERSETEREARTRDALAAEEQHESARRAMAELESARAQLADAIAEQSVTVAHLDGELRTARQPYLADQAAHERLERQVASREELQGRLQGEAQAIASRLEATARELSGKQEEVDALGQELEPAREELRQFESRERSLSAELVEANGGLRDAERGLHDAQNDVRIRHEELESLRVSLESEGFVATEDGDVERAPDPEPEPEAAVAVEDGEGGLPGWLRSDDGPDLPPVRGGSTINPTEVRDRIAELRGQIRGLGPVNEQAATDYADSRERYDFLSGQLTDLQQAEEQLDGAIAELEGIIRERFRDTFKVVNREFERYFTAFFRGGTARLEIGETDDDGLPGVEIFAQPPGKKLGSLALLSGGERSLTAVALLFALLQANPSPICVLDEVDAALDEANVGRFVEELRALAERTQFIIITHNRRTIEIADTIYGVSMGADSVSRVLSLKLADVKTED